jgi:hypothetical protein
MALFHLVKMIGEKEERREKQREKERRGGSWIRPVVSCFMRKSMKMQSRRESEDPI